MSGLVKTRQTVQVGAVIHTTFCSAPVSPSQTLYRYVERLLGRALCWRIGRWLYQGSRRELTNDPHINGEYGLVRAWVRANQTMPPPTGGYALVDVGANVGDWSAHLIEQMRLSGISSYRLWAFEPAPAQRDQLDTLCHAAISAGNMTVDDRGLAAEPGSVAFNIVGDNAGSNALAPSGAAPVSGALIEIVVTTLDSVFAEQQVAHLHFIKVDTEGNDFNVILGAKGLFDREAIDILQFEYNWRWTPFGRSLHEVFEFLNLRPYLIGRVTPQGLEIYDAWHPELERFIETNYAIVHRNRLANLPHWRATFDAANTAVPA